MGDRGNIGVRVRGDRTYNKPGASVVFYTHWSGSDIAKIAQAALAKKWRWDDPTYLARIVFCQMIGKDTESETGYGISTNLCDNEHDIVLIDPFEKKVHLLPANRTSPSPFDTDKPPKPKKTWTFDEFIAELFGDSDD